MHSLSRSRYQPEIAQVRMKEVSKTAQKWNTVEPDSNEPDRQAQHNTLRKMYGPPPNANCSIAEGNFVSARKLLINEPLLRHVQ